MASPAQRTILLLILVREHDERTRSIHYCSFCSKVSTFCPVSLSQTHLSHPYLFLDSKGYGIAVAVFAGISCFIGLLTIFFVKGKAENFFVAGRSLPLWIVIPTLAAQSLDSNALLGNVDLGYKFHFWDGAVLPLGLGLSLVLNGIFLARHVNNDNVLTLPDIYAKRYGKVVEILISCICITSFLFLLAGNLVGT